MSYLKNPKKQFYDAHIFFCLNERPNDHPRGSCSARGSIELHALMKKRAKELKIKNIRVNKAGCLERCELGPVVVIYPEGIWYKIQTKQDVEDVLQKHIIKGEVVQNIALDINQINLPPKQKQYIEVQVMEVKTLTDEIKSFELSPIRGEILPPFTSGSHIDIVIDNLKKRSYSLANNPKEHHRYLISVLREARGKGGSKWMHTQIREGDQLKITAPKNDFNLAKEASSHLFIAGGIGITPILSMGYHLKNCNAERFLHYCTRNLEQTAFLDEVKDVFGKNLILHHDDGNPKNGINLTEVLKNRKSGQHLYICGPRSLIDCARSAASNWPEDKIHIELFSSGDIKPSIQNKKFNVIIASTNQILEVKPGKSILEVVRNAGIKANSSCENGMCGTCRTSLLNGTADHQDEVLTEAEKNAQTDVMICVSRAKEGETLILDL